VPVVAGQRQRTGREAAAKVIETTFTPGRDVFRLNLAPGYAVPALRTLERTFVYDRAELGALTVRDEVVFAEPSSFETALVTWGEAKEVAPGRLEIRDGGARYGWASMRAARNSACAWSRSRRTSAVRAIPRASASSSTGPSNAR
jgi:hypothetical protein